jgi:prepilin-type N-terminal cleavage/methylation domain-containing protein
MVTNGARWALPGSGQAGFTLVEVVVCMALGGIIFGGLLTSHLQGAYRAEWSGYSLAAQSLANQQVEQARSAVWDTMQYPVKNEIANLLTNTAAVLDLPLRGTNTVWATNHCTVQSISLANAPGASVYMVRVETVWPFTWGKKTRYFTNTVADYFAPE